MRIDTLVTVPPHLAIAAGLGKKGTAASDIGPRMVQRQLTVDLHQLPSYSGSVAEDTGIRRAGEERVRNS
jgi:hypothetical protein